MSLTACRACAVLFSFACLHASDTPAFDPDLPQPFDIQALQSVVTQSPFTRTVSFDQTYQLTGIADVEGWPVATILNKETKQRYVITEEPNALGWKLLTATSQTDPQHGQVEIQVGAETISLHMNGMAPPPEADGKKSKKEKALLAASGGKSDGPKIRPSSYLGENGKTMYASLSREARDKFTDLLKTRLTQHPELTKEQNEAYAKKVFVKIQASDPGASTRAAKPAKPSKKKQGV